MNKHDFKSLPLEKQLDYFQKNANKEKKYLIAGYKADCEYSITNHKCIGYYVKERNEHNLECNFKVDYRLDMKSSIGDLFNVNLDYFIPLPDFCYDAITTMLDDYATYDDNSLSDLFEEVFLPNGSDFSLYTFLDNLTDSDSSYLEWGDSITDPLVEEMEKDGMFESEEKTFIQIEKKVQPTIKFETTKKTLYEEKKESKSMFKGMKMFKGLGEVDLTRVKMTMFGLGVQNDGGVIQTYNPITCELTDVTDFELDMFGDSQNMVFAFPAQKVAKGDLVVFNGEICYVIDVKGTRITAVNYNTNQEVIIIKQRHALGFNFVQKIICPFGNMFTKTSKDPIGGFESMLPLMMLSSMGKSDSDDKMGNLMQMMVMSQMLGGQSGNPFANLLGGVEEDYSTESSEE